MTYITIITLLGITTIQFILLHKIITIINLQHERLNTQNERLELHYDRLNNHENIITQLANCEIVKQHQNTNTHH